MSLRSSALLTENSRLFVYSFIPPHSTLHTPHSLLPTYYNMDRALMTARLLEFETQAFSLSHSLSRCSSDLDPQVVLLLQKAAPACYHIRAPLARALEGGQETIFNEICDLIAQTQTRIRYKMPFASTATMHSRVRVLIFGVSFGCAVVYRYHARIRRLTGWATRWGRQARRFLGSTLPPGTSPPATRNRRYPNIPSTLIRPVSNTPLCRMQSCEWASRSC